MVEELALGNSRPKLASKGKKKYDFGTEIHKYVISQEQRVKKETQAYVRA